MRDHSAIHPELRSALWKLPPFSVGRHTLWFFRAALRLLPSPTLPSSVAVRDVLLVHGEQRTEVRLRIYRPIDATGALPALLWIHGGGYVMGLPEMDDATCADYVHELGIVVVSVDYRLAPRHRFPAALEDCHAALTWLKASAGAIHVDAARIAIGGASAGGGLAAALAQLACDRAQVVPLLQLLIYPMLDDATSHPRQAASNDGHLFWTRSSNRFGWQEYLGPDQGATKELAAQLCAVPARRRNLAGLPPAWIGVGTADLFHEEDVAYARRLEESGVDCELCVVPGAFHGFDVAAPRATIVREFRAAQLNVLRRYLLR